MPSCQVFPGAASWFTAGSPVLDHCALVATHVSGSPTGPSSGYGATARDCVSTDCQSTACTGASAGVRVNHQLMNRIGTSSTPRLITMSRGREFEIDGRAMPPMVTHALRGVGPRRLDRYVTMV